MLTRADIAGRVAGITRLQVAENFISKNFQRNVINEEIDCIVDVFAADGVRITRAGVAARLNAATSNDAAVRELLSYAETNRK